MARSILIVDDDESIRIMLGLVFENAGYEARTARTGSEALNLLRSGLRPSLMLLDLMMPDMSGEQLLVLLQDAHLRLPTVILSGSDRACDLVHSHLAEQCLVKPVAMETLLGVAERYGT